MEEHRGFVETMLDTTFSSFITAKFIRFLYILVLFFGACMALVYLFAITAAIAQAVNGFIAFIVAVPLALFFTVLWVVAMRIWLEIVVVVFRMAENIQFLADHARDGARPPAL